MEAFSQVYMSSRVTIGNIVFVDKVSGIKVNTSFKNLTQTAIITMPNYTSLSTDKELSKAITNGSAVKIELGYNEDFKTEFEGYISRIMPKQPLEFHCEDEMWQLKQKTVSKAWKEITLSDLLKELVPGIVVNCPTIVLKPFRLDNVSIARALEKLKDEYLLNIYFRGKTLFAGFAYYETGLGSVNYSFQENLPENQESLEFRRLEDVKVKIRAISISPDNKKTEITTGDDGGDTITLNFYNKTETELKELASEKLSKIKYDGYKGTLKAFGKPWVTHGMSFNLEDSRFPERKGSYYIDAVTVDFDNNGFRRTISPGRKAT